MYHTKFGVIRPPELWGDGRSVKKRRPGTRINIARAEGGEGGKRPRKSEPQGLEAEEEEEEEEEKEEEKELPVGDDVVDQSMANIFEV